jgi:hypothetical protein
MTQPSAVCWAQSPGWAGLEHATSLGRCRRKVHEGTAAGYERSSFSKIQGDRHEQHRSRSGNSNYAIGRKCRPSRRSTCPARRGRDFAWRRWRSNPCRDAAGDRLATGLPRAIQIRGRVIAARKSGVVHRARIAFRIRRTEQHHALDTDRKYVGVISGLLCVSAHVTR